jgi:hypothetical protein
MDRAGLRRFLENNVRRPAGCPRQRFHGYQIERIMGKIQPLQNGQILSLASWVHVLKALSRQNRVYQQRLAHELDLINELLAHVASGIANAARWLTFRWVMPAA